MVWLVTLMLFTAIFTVALTGKYKDETIELKQELLNNDEEWQEKMFETVSEYHQQIVELQNELDFYRRK